MLPLSIILVRPQMGENIGATARVMANFGLKDLRIVAPRDGWPNPIAYRVSAGADAVLDRARICTDIASAVADLHTVYATASFTRDMPRAVITPRPAISELMAAAQAGQGVGIMFGCERAGLSNEDMDCCAKLISIPVEPTFNSLNLAQAVAVVAYEWRMAVDDRVLTAHGVADAAPLSDLYGLFDHFEGALDRVGFFFPADKRPSMVRRLRALLTRAQMSEAEVRTLRGAVRALIGRHMT